MYIEGFLKIFIAKIKLLSSAKICDVQTINYIMSRVMVYKLGLKTNNNKTYKLSIVVVFYVHIPNYNSIYCSLERKQLRIVFIKIH